MKISLAVLPCLWLGPGVTAQDQPYSTWMADSQIKRGVAPTRYYAEATFYRGVEAVYNLTGKETYKTYIASQVDAVLTANGSFRAWDFKDHQLDNIRIGATLLFLYLSTGQTKYRTAATFLRGQLDVQKRTRSGGFWHKDPKYPHQMWLDGLYMAGPFHAQYTQLFEPANTTAWDDIVLQFDLVERHCRNETTGLLYHGYDESGKAVWANPVTGASPHFWDRAVGWYFMALVDTLDYFPETHPGRERLLEYYTTLARALIDVQEPSGGFWLVLDSPGRKGNYIESSATAMFTYGWLKGVQKNYLTLSPNLENSARSWGYMTNNFVAKNGTGGLLNWEGTVRVGSLDQDGSFKVRWSRRESSGDEENADAVYSTTLRSPSSKTVSWAWALS